MPTLWAASLRHLLHHPAQLALALVGLSLGVGSVIAVDIATASSRRAFELSMIAVNGPATHEIRGAVGGVEESVFASLRRRSPDFALAATPVLEGYVSIASRTLQLAGIDPFATLQLQLEEASDSGGGARALLDAAHIDLTRWLAEPGAVVLAERTARELGLLVNQPFEIEVAGVAHRALLIGTVPADRPGADSLVLTDIAQAQEWLGLPGRLSRIDLRLPPGRRGESDAERISASLPAGLRLDAAGARTRESIDMTAAFTTNLHAMSLLALLVSTLLIYGAVSFAVVQRRRIMAVLRALGATRREILTIVLTEGVLLGACGAGMGLLLGLGIAHSLVQLVSQTINDLYYVVAVNATVLPPSSVAKAVGAGLGAALCGALVPALEVAGGPPQLGLRRSALEGRAVRLAGRLAVASAGLALLSGIIVMVSGRSLFWGLVSLFTLLLSVAALTPAALRGLALAAAGAAAPVSPVVRLACGDIAASLSRTGVAVAALGMAVAAMIGVSIMVESFRESLRHWLEQSIRADIYVSVPGPGDEAAERQIDTDLIARVRSTPGIADVSLSRRVTVQSSSGALSLDALQPAHAHLPGLPFVAGDVRQVWPALESGAVLVSEPLAWRLHLRVGQALVLLTATGPQSFDIAGIYREYGDDRGSVMIGLAQYQRRWRDSRITGLGIYLARSEAAPRVMAAIRDAARGRQAVLVRSNRELRELSMSIFERTFVITRVLYWLAAGVAAIGLVSALLAWELERSHEIALLRALGLTPRATGMLLIAQTGFMGLVAMLAALPAGLLTALLLIDVINRRAFGWQIDLHVSAAQLGNALLLSMAAAIAGGLYPAWRSGRAPIASDIREE